MTATTNKFNALKLELSQALDSTIKDLFSIEFESYSLLSPPAKKGSGDLAFPCFPITKLAKVPPHEVSAKIKEALGSHELIQKLNAAGPYLNIDLNLSYAAGKIILPIIDGSYYQVKLFSNTPKTMIEYSQPNTHKELHVGHMRNLCLGDAMVKIYRYCDHETISTTFPGDVGTHVAKCLWYYKYKNDSSAPTENKGAWLGTLYTKANNLLEDEKGTPAEEKNREVLTQILKELENKSGEFYELWKETRSWSIELMEKVYDWAEVKFDSWYWESDVDSDSVKLIKKYHEQGLFIKDQGAIGIDLSDDKLGFCLLLKSDGTGLYATKDVELARRKFDDYKVEKNIYVVDNRQSLHFKQVFKTLEKMNFKDADKCYHLQYEMVELPDGAMSSRKGNIVPLTDLVEQMESKIKTDYLSKYADSWEQAEIDQTAQTIAQGAIKYGMTKIDSNKKIIFDMNEWLKLDGDSGPYIQYVCARINSMLGKEEINYQAANFSFLKEDKEKEILQKLNEFNETVVNALKNHKTHLITSYLYDLAKLFNSYYAEYKIMNISEEDVKIARSTLTYAIKKHLEEGLGLLGIKAPKRM